MLKMESVRVIGPKYMSVYDDLKIMLIGETHDNEEIEEIEEGIYIHKFLFHASRDGEVNILNEMCIHEYDEYPDFSEEKLELYNRYLLNKKKNFYETGPDGSSYVSCLHGTHVVLCTSKQRANYHCCDLRRIKYSDDHMISDPFCTEKELAQFIFDICIDDHDFIKVIKYLSGYSVWEIYKPIFDSFCVRNKIFGYDSYRTIYLSYINKKLESVKLDPSFDEDKFFNCLIKAWFQDGQNALALLNYAIETYTMLSLFELKEKMTVVYSGALHTKHYKQFINLYFDGTGPSYETGSFESEINECTFKI